MKDNTVKPEILAIIPARGGSKGIPRKNVRLLAGRPLIAYCIEAALGSGLIDTVVVSTEDEEIAEVSRMIGATVVPRPLELARDDTTLDPVIIHAVRATEACENRAYDFVVTIQPTSPLLSAQTIKDATELMLNNDYDTLITVASDRHLHWALDNGVPVPLYKERKNRQEMEPKFRETGAMVISRRRVLDTGSRIGERIHIFEMPEWEAIDVDTYADWWVAESLLRKLKIAFRAEGDETIGLGHVYRALTLANRIFAHDVFLLTDETKELGTRKLRAHNYPVLTYRSEDEFFELLRRVQADIIVNDTLDTDSEYVRKLRHNGLFVVSFEDLGEGAEVANIVINALYENSCPPANHYYGFRYECLRDEFYLLTPRRVNDRVHEILISFGGVDENNLTLRTLRAIDRVGLKHANITVITGLGYPFREELRSYLAAVNTGGPTIEVKDNVSMMSKHIAASDLVITSNGRTVYEVASLGVPCLSISQNEREVRHLFSQVCKGVINLGMAASVSEADIASALDKIVNDHNMRRKMSESMLRFDLKKGIDRCLRLILDGFWEWKEDGMQW